MSTSDPDLEARLAALRPPPPRDDLRTEVLSSVRAELAWNAQPSLLDRLLEKPWTWTAAASLLVALVGALWLTNQAQEHRIEELAARPKRSTSPHLMTLRHRDALLARLLRPGDHDE